MVEVSPAREARRRGVQIHRRAAWTRPPYPRTQTILFLGFRKSGSVIGRAMDYAELQFRFHVQCSMCVKTHESNFVFYICAEGPLLRRCEPQRNPRRRVPHLARAHGPHGCDRSARIPRERLPPQIYSPGVCSSYTCSSCQRDNQRQRREAKRVCTAAFRVPVVRITDD